MKLVWSSKCDAIFQQMKHLLMSSKCDALVLKISNPEKDFLVCTDACKEGLGGVLMQEGNLICYDSRKLNEHEHSYVTHELDLATIVHDLKMWRNYFLQRRFVLMEDHCGLKYIFD